MLTSLLKRNRTRESGFTMIELLVAVVIIAILAAIAVPVYINLKNEASRSALKSDVNATVKAASIALTQGTDINTITANGGAAYIPAAPAKGEIITIVQASPPASATGAAFVQDRDNSNDGYVIKSATFSGPATGVASAKAVIATADNQYFFVYGVLSKTAGAPVDYTYSYTSAGDKYSQSVGGGSATSTTPSAPALATATLPAATIGDAYSSSVITATGTPAPSYKASGLPAGLTMDATTGVISGNSTDSAATFTVTVTASNPVGSDSKTYSLTLKSKNEAPAITSAATAPTGVAGSSYAGFTLTASGYPTPTFSSSDLTTKTGLNLSTSGVISGTVSSTASGSVTVNVTASNGVGTAATQQLTIPVLAAPQITTTSLPNGTQNVAYPSTTINTSGNPKASITASTLPAGMTFVDNGNGTGTLAGKPTALTPTSITFTAHNSQSPDATKTLSISIGSASSGTFTYDFEDGTTQGWTGYYGSSANAATNIGGHAKVLAFGSYLNNNNGNQVDVEKSPAGAGVNFDKGKTYRVTYSYYLASGYQAGSGQYMTGCDMYAGANQIYGGNCVLDSWTTVTKTFVENGTADPFNLIIAFRGYNGATVGGYVDNISVTQL